MESPEPVANLFRILQIEEKMKLKQKNHI